MAAAAHEYLSPDEYLARERQAETKHEYYDGVLIAMVGGSPTHSEIAMGAGVAFANKLRGRSCKVYNSDIKVGMGKRKTYVYPDVTVVCGTPQFGEDERDVLLNPLVIVEVLSPSTEQHDRTRKFLSYQRIPTFAEYLLISQVSPRVELCSRQSDGFWEWSIAEGLEATIAIPALACTIALADIYYNVTFGES
jgi:Uma2 family endonuclease